MMKVTVLLLLVVLHHAASLETRCLTRRTLGAAASSVIAQGCAVVAYDAIPPVNTDFEKNEKLRVEREARMRKNRERIAPLLKAVDASQTGEDYASAVDKLSLWLIGEGSLPEGIDAGLVRDCIQDNYETLPKKCFPCEVTRTNNGVCCTPGQPADGAYYAGLRELRKYATRKGKGSLMSDGVSAANSAAF